MSESSQLVIRQARAQDAPQILEFIIALAEYEKLRDEVVATVEDLEQTLFGPRPAAEVVIAERNGEPAGFALFFPSYSTFLARPGIYLEDLFVLPAQRGAGIGLALLRHLARLAVDRGCGRLDWSVLDWNEPAIGFYRRIGARGLDDWTQFRLDGESLTALAAGKD
ncbi:GNAT family N-acetyltransferase [Elongatibacter sediminis]|uniref:GNAT family N-acetyltransferase n=1 Tax=Elongatibacter sediminis TaxID=3119006 RepID=A0AAW9RA43_9GAMM